MAGVHLDDPLAQPDQVGADADGAARHHRHGDHLVVRLRRLAGDHGGVLQVFHTQAVHLACTRRGERRVRGRVQRSIQTVHLACTRRGERTVRGGVQRSIQTVHLACTRRGERRVRGRVPAVNPDRPPRLHTERGAHGERRGTAANPETRDVRYMAHRVTVSR